MKKKRWLLGLLLVLVLLSGCSGMQKTTFTSLEDLNSPSVKIGVATGSASDFAAREAMPNAEFVDFVAVPDGCAALKGAPHPDNAKLFLDFAVSYDVQQLLQSDFYRRPVRSDVSPASKLPELSAIRQVAYDVSWASEHREAILMSWAFYLGTEAEQ